MNDDSRLINETLAGNTAAFGQLVDTYQDRLLTTFVHLIGNHAEAEEVVQETFVQAYTKLGSFQGRSGFYTWIYRIAFNQWASRRRRKRPTASVDQSRDDLGDEPTDVIDTPLQRLERQERVALVQQALSQLSDDYRTILVLREMEGCDYESIAKILELPVGTVRSRLFRARMQLKRRLEIVLNESA